MKSVEKVKSLKQIISYRANRVLVEKDQSDDLFENSVRLPDKPTDSNQKSQGLENVKQDKSDIEKIKNLDKDFE